jgi:hypothetical protein
MKVFIGDDAEVLADRNVGENTNGSPMSNIQDDGTVGVDQKVE